MFIQDLDKKIIEKFVETNVKILIYFVEIDEGINGIEKIKQ